MLFYDGHKVYMNGDYPAIFLNGQNVHIHRLEWKKHKGEIPYGQIVHHKDENKLNWSIDNLELLSRGEHIKTHCDVVHRKGIKIIASKGNVHIHFNSIEEAAENCGTYTICINRIFRGKQKSANGWMFERG